MIDNLLITLTYPNYKPQPSAEFERSRRYDKTYRYYSKIEENGVNGEAGPETAFLDVTYNKTLKELNIYGSIRKWVLGKHSTEDLTINKFKHGIKDIAKRLDIELKELLTGHITQYEVGLTIESKIDPKRINEQILKFRNWKYYRYAYETVGFLSEDYDLKLYDKATEIIAHTESGEIKARKRRVFEILTEFGHHFYRIEFELKDKRSFENAKLTDMNILREAYLHYGRFIDYFLRECHKIRINTGINFDDENMTKYEYAILIGIEHLGYQVFLERFQEKSTIKKGNKGKKSPSSASSARTDAKNEIDRIVEKYQDTKTEYTQSNLRIDIHKRVKKLYGEDYANLHILLGKENESPKVRTDH